MDKEMDGHIDRSILSFSDDEIEKNFPYFLSKLEEHVGSMDECLEYGSFALGNVACKVNIEDMERLFRVVCPGVTEVFVNIVSSLTLLKDNNLLSQTQIDSADSADVLLELCTLLLQAVEKTCDHLISIQRVNFRQVGYFVKHVRDISLAIEDVGINAFKENFLKEYFLVKFKYATLLAKVAFDERCEDEMDELKEIMLTLTESVMVDSFVSCEHQKVAAENWKCIVTLLEKYEEVKNIYNPSKSVAFLCLTLSSYLDKLSSPDPPLREVKFHNFLLRILVKLCKIFSTLDEPSYSLLLDLLSSLFRLTHFHLLSNGMSQVEVDGIIQNLGIGADPLLAALLSHSRFPLVFDSGIRSRYHQNPYGYLIVLLSLIKRLFSNYALRTSYSAQDLLDLAFECFELCSDGLLEGVYIAPGTKNSDLYTYTFIRLTALICYIPPEEFFRVEETLVKNILQSNFWKAMLASDVLCFIVKYSEPELCHSLLETLIQVASFIEDRDSRPEFVTLTSLLRRLTSSCNREFLKYLIDTYPRETYKWIPKSACDFEAKNWTVLISWKDSGKEDNDGIDAMEFLSNISEKIEKEDYLEAIADLWKIEAFPFFPNKFIRSLCSVTTKALPSMTPSTIILVVQRALKFFENTNVSASRLEISDIFDHLSTIELPPSVIPDIYEYLARFYKSILTTTNRVLMMIGWKSLLIFARTTPHVQCLNMIVPANTALHEEFVSFLTKKLPLAIPAGDIALRYDYRHTCHDSGVNVDFSEEEVSTAKKIRLEKDDVEELVVSFEKSAAHLQKSFEGLTTSQVKRIEIVAKNLLDNIKLQSQ